MTYHRWCVLWRSKNKLDGKVVTYHRWCVLWRSKNKLDGKVEHFIFDNFIPIQFFTKREAKEYIDGKYGYLKTRKDLRNEPFGWLLPIPVKVSITIKKKK